MTVLTRGTTPTDHRALCHCQESLSSAHADDKKPWELAGRLAFAPAAAVFRGVGDAGRLTLLRRLVAEEPPVGELTAALVMPQSTVSTYLPSLRECNLGDVRPHGRAPVHFRAHPEQLGLLAAADTWPAVPGVAVAFGAGYGDARDEPRADTATPTSRHEEST